jgi:regulator of protease activity HflC (stomatin/prohibitin superfamily)
MFWKTFYIQSEELGFLYNRRDFQRVLQPGIHRFLGSHWSVVTYNLNQSQAQIDNWQLLLRRFPEKLEPYLNVVTTDFNEAAIVQVDQEWLVIPPNETRLFWKGLMPVAVQKFSLDQSLQLPPSMVYRLRDLRFTGIDKYQISETQLGLIYLNNNFVGTLPAGEHAFFNFSQQLQLKVLDRTDPRPDFPQPEVLLDRHPEFVAAHCEAVELAGREIAIIREKGKIVAILPPAKRQLFWQGIEVEKIDLETQAKLTPAQIKELVNGLPAAKTLSESVLYIATIAASHVGMLYVNEEFQEILPAGVHAWWRCGRTWQVEPIDLRLQNLEVSGQDILSKDKVPLRLNLMAGLRITDPLRTREACRNIQDFVYQELQFALRSAVGERTLDAILEDKGAIDSQIAIYIQEKVVGYGVEILSVGVKDIILPGEIRTILSKVVEAEKSAQANVVRRREETAATRSMLNTARVMEDNPVALRLKELEVLERIAEKIDRIQVGSLDGILKEMIKIDRP